MNRTKPDAETVLPALAAIAEETRLRLVELLADGERCVCELQAELGAAQSRLSFHLRKLKEAGVVADRREGRWVYYSLVPESVERMESYLGGLTGEPRRWRARARCE